jgi:F0F1-type ATP synthase assembly protein I
MDGESSRGIPPQEAITGGFSEGADFFTYILTGLLIGLLLDWLTGWSPVLTIVWSLLGIGVGSWRMWLRSASIEEDADGISHGV